MKKLFSFIAVICLATTVSAQYQLPNPGFDGTWNDIKPYVGQGVTSTNVGTTPSGWCVANVAGYKAILIGWTGKTIIATRVDGRTGYACKLENVTETVTKKNVIPGYVSLGTTWNTANSSGGDGDGGVFGGIAFTGRPDAIEFYYKRTLGQEGNEQPASVVAYLWKGSTSQKDVPVDIAISSSGRKTETMVNRERNILGMPYSQGGEVSTHDGFELVASLKEGEEHVVRLTELSENNWLKATCEFTYNNQCTSRPQMLNVVFASMDNFADRSVHESGNTLTVDDVRFLYYSELASATYNGNAITFNGTSATVNEYYDASKLNITSNGHGATVETNLNEATQLLTVTIKGDNISEDATNVHTYTIQFKKPYEKGDVNMDGSVTIADVTMLVNMILGKAEKNEMANINGDGDVTIADVTALVNIILGKN